MLNRSVVFAILAIATASPQSMALDVGDIAPDFTLKTVDARESVTLSQWRGNRAVMLVFWATWCPNCMAEIPAIKRIDAELKDTIKVVGVNVDINDSPSKAVAYKSRNSISYTMVYDHGTKVGQSYGIMGVPTVFIIGKEGTVRYKDVAVPKAAEIKKNMYGVIE